MDGPNVNWDVLKLHSSYRDQSEFSRLTNIGSCGLHVLHRALRLMETWMETDWEINKVLHALWKILGKSPARRDIYIFCDIVLCIFARPDGSRMNPMLHKEFRYGRILSRLWSTGFHCQEVNGRIIIKSFDTLVKYCTDKLTISKLHFVW